MNKTDGGPAFPTESEGQTGASTWRHEGMTLRDYFAAQAIPGVMQMVSDGKHEPSISNLPIQQVDFIATSAYELADAMIRVRAKK